MSENAPDKRPIAIPEVALKELEQVEEMEVEFSLKELAEWVNDAVERFLPETEETRDQRVSNSFTERTLRHYQTLGCIDAPKKKGRRAIYRFKHYLQALLIRKLLYRRCSPELIRETLTGKSVSQYKKMLFSDIVVIPQHAASLTIEGTSPSLYPKAQQWKRIVLHEGVELHIDTRLTDLTNDQKKQLLTLLNDEISQL